VLNIARRRQAPPWRRYVRWPDPSVRIVVGFDGVYPRSHSRNRRTRCGRPEGAKTNQPGAERSAAPGPGGKVPPSPERAREPQWLGLSLPKKKRRGEERRAACSTETYLCGSAPVQNFLLAPRNFAGVSSQGGATGGTGEGTVTKGPGRKTPGDGSIGRRGTPSTALSRSVGDRPDDPHVAGHAVIGHEPRRCCLQPPGENGPRP
jgi:hypothetical protein